MTDVNELTIERRVGNFDSRHGNDAIRIGGLLIFSDGASREVAMSGMMSEPPADPRECCKAQIQYREEKLRSARRNFEDMKRELVGRAQGNLNEKIRTPPPPCEANVAVQEMERLRGIVSTCQSDLEQIRQQLVVAKPEWQQNMEASAAANQERNQQFISAINAIQI
jgi:hypothetical protein